MNKMKIVLSGLLFGAFLMVSPSSASAANIVEVASGNPDFSSLVSAVVSQNLQGTLSGPGPFTVFAPTNEAFANIPPIVKKALDRNPALLKDVLLYHVVSGDVKASTVVTLKTAKTVQGSRAQVTVSGGKVMVDNADVVKTDIQASNGTVHVINKVLVPRSILVTAALAEIQEILAKIAQIKQEGLMLDASTN